MTTPAELPLWSDLDKHRTRTFIQQLLNAYHDTSNKQDFIQYGTLIMDEFCEPDYDLLAFTWYALDAAHDR